jgi:hypothetical protein
MTVLYVGVIYDGLIYDGLIFVGFDSTKFREFLEQLDECTNYCASVAIGSTGSH